MKHVWTLRTAVNWLRGPELVAVRSAPFAALSASHRTDAEEKGFASRPLTQTRSLFRNF